MKCNYFCLEMYFNRLCIHIMCFRNSETINSAPQKARQVLDLFAENERSHPPTQSHSKTANISNIKATFFFQGDILPISEKYFNCIN